MECYNLHGSQFEALKYSFPQSGYVVYLVYNQPAFKSW